MDPSQADISPPPRPYFLPAGIDFASLPEAVRLAFREIVQPAYDELVLRTTDSLERAAGVSLVFLLSLELLEQFQMAEQLGFAGQPAMDADERDKHIRRYLRLVGAKQQSANFLARVRQLRIKCGPLAWSRP